MKRLMFICLCAVFILSLCGCGRFCFAEDISTTPTTSEVEPTTSEIKTEPFYAKGNPVYCTPVPEVPLSVISHIMPTQEGIGTPSLDNIRNIIGVSSLTLSQATYDDNTLYTLEFGKNMYAGVVDWYTGEVKLTHKLFNLPIATMNNLEEYPGWSNVEGFSECFSLDAYQSKERFNTANDDFLLNLGETFSVNYNYSIIYLPKGDYNKTLSEWQEEHADLVMQLVAPLLEPKYVYLKPTRITAKEGMNVFSCETGILEITGVKEATNEVSGNQQVYVNAVDSFDPYVWGLPVLELYGETSKMTKDNSVDLSYIYNDMTGQCSVKWQGSSSLTYDKKNYTIKFDQPFEAAEGWGEQKEYCLKANYIDHSHARNIVNAKLWGEIVNSRDKVPEILSNLPNAGAVDGFPIIVLLNSEFHGLYTFNIPKDGWMFNMGDGKNEAIICADKWVDATGFRAPALIDESDFALEYVTDEENSEWVADSLNRLIDACMNSDGTDLDTKIGQYIDWQSAIDYYIFTVLVEGSDMTRKNYLLVTFDGAKWYFSAYDMDSTFGLHWNGKSWFPADYNPNFESYAKEHLLMKLIRTYKLDELKERYWKLRKTVLSESNVATLFSNFIGQIPTPVYLQDIKEWPMIPNSSVSNISQIINYYRMRVELADQWIENLE